MALPSSKASDAKAAFAELLESGASGFLKRLIQHGHTIVHHVILHDTFTGDDETLKKAQNGIASLSDSRKYLGNVLLYNSNAPPIDSNKSFGAFVEEFVVKRLAPHVESRIRMLDQTVMSTRRGLRNQLRSLWMKTSSSSSGGVMRDAQSTVRTGSRQSGTPNEEEVYDLDSPEVQLRCLCDLSMMVGDFDLACTVLRVLAADLKQDKAYFEYAWSQETLAVATILSSGTISEAIANFREAYHRYDQVAQQQLKAPGAGNGSVKYSSLYATRAAVMLADFLIALSRFNDASTILMKSHFQENDIRAALLLDRAAHLLLQGTKAQVRKFAFHMVLAGLRYNKAGAQELAARAYSLALEVYDKREWEIIEEHVHESLGKIYRDIGDISSASKHFGAILACASIPPQQQQTHITQYAETRGLGKEGVRVRFFSIANPTSAPFIYLA